jgi:hypothetical protein
MPADAGSGDSSMLLLRPHSAEAYDLEEWPVVVFVP